MKQVQSDTISVQVVFVLFSVMCLFSYWLLVDKVVSRESVVYMLLLEWLIIILSTYQSQKIYIILNTRLYSTSVHYKNTLPVHH